MAILVEKYLVIIIIKVNDYKYISSSTTYIAITYTCNKISCIDTYLKVFYYRAEGLYIMLKMCHKCNIVYDTLQ